MTSHSSLNIFLDVLAVQTDTGHQNSRMCEIATVRVLQGASTSTSAPSLDHASPSTPPKPCFVPHEHFIMTYTGPSGNATP